MNHRPLCHFGRNVEFWKEMKTGRGGGSTFQWRAKPVISSSAYYYRWTDVVALTLETFVDRDGNLRPKLAVTRSLR
ncbi:unnamed protein product [Heligmosomoides polygyrus]|uniref:Transposase n=1 Tax=Heligmosomoides polygyrus TaxID=6339 RepID=A0A183G7P2_HELPZ|nr:unnamed protein product [Heligmosomoides polygyrus]